MFLQSLEFFFSLAQEKINIVARIFVTLVPCLVTAFLLRLVLDQDIVLSVIISFVVVVIYRFGYIWILKSLPLSFTLGEGSIVAQALTIFLYNCYLQLPLINEAKSASEELSLLLQLGLIGVFVLVIISKTIPVFRNWYMFYLLLLSVIAAVCLMPIRDSPAVTILFNFIFSDIKRIVIVGIYVVLVGIAGFAVNYQIGKNQRATTSTRKIFHILIVFVFVPGLIFQCLFLYVASVIILAIFVVLELARVIKLYPFADILESSIEAFIDEKDAGKVALTPIYLLVGCSAPLWIHNSPCEFNGSSAFELLPLLSGVISIGFGDTFASIIGSKIGRHKWCNTSKSIEGTIAGIIAQAGLLAALYPLGLIIFDLKFLAVCTIGVIANSLIEALTDQVDNLVLPLVTYIILVYK